MGLAQEFITKHMWTTALAVGTYTTAGQPHVTTEVSNGWRDAYAMQLFLKVTTNTGAVTLTPTIEQRIGSGAYETFKVLDAFVPEDALNSAYIFKFEWEKMGLDEGRDGFRFSLGLVGGTSIAMSGTWIYENLKRFPFPGFHLDGVNALGNDSNGNPKIIRVDEVI